MFRKLMPLSRIVMVMSIAALVIGIVFIYQGVSKASSIKNQMEEQKIPASMFVGNATGYIDSAGEAQAAADTLNEHLQSIAPSYLTLMQSSPSGRYDPTNSSPYPANPKMTVGQAMLEYSQGLTMESYLSLGVLALGFTEAVTVIGVFMILVGIALMAVWAVIRKKKAAEVKSAVIDK